MNPELIIKFQKAKLDPYLTCSLCDGYFRFAHTIAECGHTFCKICIFSYLQNLKSSYYKCPSCAHTIENNYHKSIKKDPYKQNLVDTLYPHYATQERNIIKKIKELFPEHDLQNIIEEYQFDNNANTKYLKRKKIKSLNERSLSEIIYEKLNIDFETFVKGINEESKFNDFKKRINIIEKKKRIALEKAAINESTKICLPKEILNEKIESYQTYFPEIPKNNYQINPTPVPPPENKNNEISKNIDTNANMNIDSNDKQQSTVPLNKDSKELQDVQDLMLSLHPKSNSDFQIVQLKNVLKFKTKSDKAVPFPAEHVKRLIIKRVLSLASQNKDKINFEKVNLENVILYSNEKIIEDSKSLSDLRTEFFLANQPFIIYYEILFKI